MIEPPAESRPNERPPRFPGSPLAQWRRDRPKGLWNMGNGDHSFIFLSLRDWDNISREGTEQSTSWPATPLMKMRMFCAECSQIESTDCGREWYRTPERCQRHKARNLSHTGNAGPEGGFGGGEMMAAERDGEPDPAKGQPAPVGLALGLLWLARQKSSASEGSK